MVSLSKAMNNCIACLLIQLSDKKLQHDNIIVNSLKGILHLQVLYSFLHFIFFTITGYCFLRIFIYPAFRLLTDENELYSNPKLSKTMNLFYHARLYPWPNWDADRRRIWCKSWWKYLLIGIVFYGLTCLTLYLRESLKMNWPS
jgi:hypothetical protein